MAGAGRAVARQRATVNPETQPWWRDLESRLRQRVIDADHRTAEAEDHIQSLQAELWNAECRASEYEAEVGCLEDELRRLRRDLAAANERLADYAKGAS